MFTYLIAALVAIGCHRLWNYEDVFLSTRQWFQRRQARLGKYGGWLTPVLCPACNAFWVAAVVAGVFRAAGLLDTWAACSLPFAGYAGTRALVWLYNQPIGNLFKPHQCAHHAQAPAAPIGQQAAAQTPPPAEKKPGCSSCGQKAQEMKDDRAFTDKFAKRVVLMTALADFNPSYSLVSVILDQAFALALDPTRLVQIWVMEGTDTSKLPAFPENVQVKPYVPKVAWREDVIDEKAQGTLQQALLMRLFNLGNATIITHDLMLVTWFTTFAAAIHRIGKTAAFSWIHQIHSCVGPKPAQTPAAIARTTLPDGHLLAVLNSTEIEPAAAYYGIDPSRVVVIPNIVDARRWGITEHARIILAKTNLADADVAQVFPLSLPRVDAKGLEHVTRTHGELRRLGKTTALVVADAHATTPMAAGIFDRHRKIAAEVGVPLAFVSQLIPEVATFGVGSDTIRDLFGVTNTFIFPSLSESAGLVALEAAAAGNHLWVNSRVPALADMADNSGGGVRKWPFPSQRNPDFTTVDYVGLANAVVTELGADAFGRYRRTFMRTNSTVALQVALNRALAAAKPIPMPAKVA